MMRCRPGCTALSGPACWCSSPIFFSTSVTPQPLAYLRSFYGLIDLSAVLFFFVPRISSDLILWIFKFVRVLRVFKLLRFLDEAQLLGNALRASARHIGVFLFFVVMTQVVLGYVMVVIESGHPQTQFQTMGHGV